MKLPFCHCCDPWISRQKLKVEQFFRFVQKNWNFCTAGLFIRCLKCSSKTPVSYCSEYTNFKNSLFNEIQGLNGVLLLVMV